MAGNRVDCTTVLQNEQCSQLWKPHNDHASAAALQEASSVGRYESTYTPAFQNWRGKAVGLEAIVGLCVKQSVQQALLLDLHVLQNLIHHTIKIGIGVDLVPCNTPEAWLNAFL